MTNRLKDKVVLVTGVSSGIGKASALLFASEGAKLVGVDTEKEKGLKIVESIKQAGNEAVFIEADVSQTNEVRKIIAEALRIYGRIDVFFNNAGIEVVKKLADTTEEEWDRVIDVNLKSVFLTCKHIIPHMIEKGGGTIINNASVAGLVGSFSTVYSASKGGIIAFTKSLAVELAPLHIRVNCICPGAIETPMLQRVFEKQGDPSVVRMEKLKSYPMGRVGRPEELAQAALFLASDESSFMTGTCVIVDGGFTAR